MLKNDLLRIFRHISETIKLFQLDLSGKRVLTEAASGHFVVTPLIAALAGAEVIALAKNSTYGKIESVVSNLTMYAEECNVSDRIRIVTKVREEDLAGTDLVTNLGFVRPIDHRIINSLPNRSVIAAMCESWEVRSEDIDLKECRQRGIPIVSVNEVNPVKNIFRYVGDLAKKMVEEARIELPNSRFMIVGSDKFAEVIAALFTQSGAKVHTIRPEELVELETTLNYDCLLIADYTYTGSIIGGEGIVTAEWLKEKLCLTKIVHLTGKVDFDNLKSNGIECYPEYNGYSRRMSKTLAYLGADPVIELHTAGLKAADLVLEELRKGVVKKELIKLFKNHNLCQLMD